MARPFHSICYPVLFCLFAATHPLLAWQSTVLRPDRVFDGVELHDGWAVLVRGDRIEAAGPADEIAAPGATIEKPAICR